MGVVGLWFGLVGAWLLFVGPVSQARLELEAEEEARARFRAVAQMVPPTRRISRWWWLVPPVMLVLSSRRRDAEQQAMREAMSAEDLALVTRYVAIFRGWLLVASGAWLIFVKETIDLVHHYRADAPGWVIVAAVVVLTLLGLGVTARSASRVDR